MTVLRGNRGSMLILVSRPPKGTSLCGTTSFDVFCIKIGARVSVVAFLMNPKKKKVAEWLCATHTHTRLTALCPGLPRWAGTRKAKPIWILLKEETVSVTVISWAICKSAPRSRQITTPAPLRSVFYRPDALPAAQPTVSKHWRRTKGREITHAQKHNPKADLDKIWRGGRYPRRSHLHKFWWQSVKEFLGGGGQIYPFPIVFSSSHNTLTVPWECVKHRNFSNGLWKALSTEANKNIFHCCPFVLSFGPQVAVAIIWFCLLSSVKLLSIIFGCNTSVTHLTINLKYWLQVKRDRYRRFLVISMLLVTCFGCLSFFIPC